MKKILGIFLLLLTALLCCCGFGGNPYVHYETSELYAFRVDMSSYRGMRSTGHHFLQTTPAELLRAVEDKESAVFYLGWSACPNCQEAVRLIEQAAAECDITVYYLNAYDEAFPLKLHLEEVMQALSAILPERDGEKTILTPFVFSLKEGVPSEKYWGLCSGYDGSEKADRKMVRIYKDIMEDFRS